MIARVNHSFLAAVLTEDGNEGLDAEAGWFPHILGVSGFGLAGCETPQAGCF